jgi:hypothetical protein
MKKIAVALVTLMIVLVYVGPVLASPPHPPNANGHADLHWCGLCWLPKPNSGSSGIRGGCWGILCVLLGCCNKAFPADQATGGAHGTPSHNPHGPF